MDSVSLAMYTVALRVVGLGEAREAALHDDEGGRVAELI